ncbi:phenylacetaldoxime dehydratase family protein [Microdochium nivale]|nr:phenylacetaldoxime dehydratase family protein [Microdochium nivale]
MWGVDLSDAPAFVYSVFGLQHDSSSPSPLVDTFDELIGPSAPHIDRVTQDGPGNATTQIWLAYWNSFEAYTLWWNSGPVSNFWSALPNDAGMWREVLTVSGRRTQYGTNKDKDNGLSRITPRVLALDKVGYWGCYRDRIIDATPKSRLQSSLAELPARSAPAADGSGKRLGRHLLTKFPDNLCFVVEGQDHSLISEEERHYWFDNFDSLATNWMQDLQNADPKETGLLDSRLCYSSKSGTFRARSPEALNYNKKIQLFYFLDLKCMERIGRSNKGHVALRDSFANSYCPAGPMGAAGQLNLWVETSIIKSDEIEAEYIGCLEGTGFLGYDYHEAFKGAGTGTSVA